MKLALIAMSGLRTFNPELAHLGMTLPGFVERGKALASLPSLGLLTLAGMTPDRWDISYHEIQDIRQVNELPECDLAAISAFTAQVKEAYVLADRFRALGIPTIIGGLHATALPQEAAQRCDAVVAGEGEVVWADVLRDFEAGRLRGVYRAIGREWDLAQAPMPRFDLLDVDRYNRITVQTSRGCPWRCEFCASSILLTSRFKVKPVEKVIAEVRTIKRLWPHPFIEFADDNSFVNRRHSKALLRALAEEDIRWFTETDISIADDEELLDLMHAAGCAQVLIGLESPTAAALDGLETRKNWKWDRLDTYREGIYRIQSRGIAVNGCFVLGLDGSTIEDFAAVRRFVEESGLYEVQLTVLTAMPGTPLYTRMAAEGRLIDPTGWERCTVFDVNVRPQNMSVEDLESGLIALGREFYGEEAKRRRKSAFKQQWREGLKSNIAKRERREPDALTGA
jgi:radical SAM superfamily enzyme YgiQ (UPF0313 family)